MTNMMNSLGLAAEANLEGSDLLEVGETSKALKAFRAGLKFLNDGCQRQRENSRRSFSSSDCIAAVSSRPVQLGANHDGISGESVSPVAPSAYYSQSFVFVVPSSEEDVSLGEHSFFSAIVIYNTALALHQKGGNTSAGHNANDSISKKKRQSLLKALLFYNEALNLLRPLLEAEQAEAFRVVQEVLRNQADIYSRLNDFGNVQRVWQDLAAITSTLGTTSSGPHQATRGNPGSIQKKSKVAASA